MFTSTILITVRTNSSAITLIFMMVLPGTEVTDSISSIEISKIQRAVEGLPLEPNLASQTSATYDVDESVRACEVEWPHCAGTSLTCVSFPCAWNTNHRCTDIWHLALGKDCESQYPDTPRRRDKLLPQGRIACNDGLCNG